jgi:hypothetical protein
VGDHRRPEGSGGLSGLRRLQLRQRAHSLRRRRHPGLYRQTALRFLLPWTAGNGQGERMPEEMCAKSSGILFSFPYRPCVKHIYFVNVTVLLRNRNIDFRHVFTGRQITCAAFDIEFKRRPADAVSLFFNPFHQRRIAW